MHYHYIYLKNGERFGTFINYTSCKLGRKYWYISRDTSYALLCSNSQTIKYSRPTGTKGLKYVHASTHVHYRNHKHFIVQRSSRLNANLYNNTLARKDDNMENVTKKTRTRHSHKLLQINGHGIDSFNTGKVEYFFP